MIDPTRGIRQVAVLGAGVMGAQAAAHIANAGIPVLLFELAGPEGDPNQPASKAIAGLKKLKPAPLAHPALAAAIQPCNYDQHLERLQACDLVIEAISERLDWKHDLYQKILPHLGEAAILATNTSGIGIESLAEVLPEAVRQRFCGTHFFNPPRYMYLLEMIRHPDTRPEVLDTLEAFFTTTLGKGVIHAKDSPSFIANRVGIFSMLAVIHHAQRLGLPFDLVDKLTGPGIGHPKSATFRTADVVGLDTFAHVVTNLHETLPDDPWRQYYVVPDWASGLIEKGAIGQKAGAGIYRKIDGRINVLDPATADYRPVSSQLNEEVRAILKERDPRAKFEALSACDHPQAQFLKYIFLDLFHFAAVHLGDIAYSARDVDLALRWGFGWQLGPFETWQAAGWQDIASELQRAMDAGETMSQAGLPAWVGEAGRTGVHEDSGSWSGAEGRLVPGSTHPVYQRQLSPPRVLGETAPARKVVYENEGVRLVDSGDDLAVLSFKSKMHAIGMAVLEGVNESLQIASRDFKAMVLWQDSPPFSVGANLQEAMAAAQQGDFDTITRMVVQFQQASLSLRYSTVPTVAAVQGMALGGGCEFMLHCDRTVAALESYIGLPEVGVGLIPGAGGSKEMALRASNLADSLGCELFPLVAARFETLGMGKVASSALEARAMGFLRPEDTVIMNPEELLHVARQQALALFEAGYRPPARASAIRVIGRDGVATIKAQLVNMLEGGFISEHDFLIGSRLASIMAGGDVDPDSRVSEDWILRLEIETFMALAQHPKSVERIFYMLENGKPLRN